MRQRRCLRCARRLPRGRFRFGLRAFAFEPREAPVVPRARRIRLFLAPCVPAGGVARDGNHRDAIDRAGRHAQVAAGAQRVDDRMHLLGRARDGIDRTCLHAQRAADAQVLVDDRKRSRALDAMRGIERDLRLAKQRRETRDAFLSARRALVVARLACRDGVGIRAAGRIAALGALRLRQQVFDALGERL